MKNLKKNSLWLSDLRRVDQDPRPLWNDFVYTTTVFKTCFSSFSKDPDKKVQSCPFGKQFSPFPLQITRAVSYSCQRVWIQELRFLQGDKHLSTKQTSSGTMW